MRGARICGGAEMRRASAQGRDISEGDRAASGRAASRPRPRNAAMRGRGADPRSCGSGAKSAPRGSGAKPPPCGRSAKPPPCGKSAKPPPCGKSAKPPPCGGSAKPPPCGRSAQGLVSHRIAEKLTRRRHGITAHAMRSRTLGARALSGALSIRAKAAHTFRGWPDPSPPLCASPCPPISCPAQKAAKPATLASDGMSQGAHHRAELSADPRAEGVRRHAVPSTARGPLHADRPEIRGVRSRPAMRSAQPAPAASHPSASAPPRPRPEGARTATRRRAARVWPGRCGAHTSQGGEDWAGAR